MHRRPFTRPPRAALLGLSSLACTIAQIAAQAGAGPVAAAGPSSQVATLRSVVRRVDVDIVVSDSEGRAVAGLTQEDFQVEEDKVRQPLRSFQIHTAESSYGASKIPSLPPNTFLNVPASQGSGPATVLLYDMLNGSSSYSREQFLAFIKQHQFPGRIAIFGLSNRLYLIQGFTEVFSAEQAYDALLRVAEEAHRNPVESFYDKTALNVRVRGLITLEALSQVGRFLAPIGGRKSLIWYSAGFPENWLPGNPIPGSPPGKSNSVAPSINPQFPPMYQDEFRKAVELLTLSHVTVYPVDIGGVSGGGPFSGSRMMDVNTSLHSAMDTFAEATGGHAFYGTNDLQGAVEQALNDSTTYYSLTYEPTNPKYDGSLRHIKVTLKKPGYNLSYRKTYYADDLNALAHAEAPESPLTPALERGLPLAHDLFVEAHLDTAGAPAPATPEQMKALSQFEAMRDRANAKAPNPPVMMQQYTVTYALFAKQLELPANEAGVRMASLEFGAMAYDEDGRKLTGLDTRVDDPLSPDRFAKIAADGYRVAQTIAIPATATCLRLAVRDVKDNRVGSLEVKLPLAKTADEPASEAKARTK